MHAKHEFALYNKYTQEIAHSLGINAFFTIDDQTLVTRITSVLRMQVRDSFIMFDCKMHINCTIEATSKKTVLCKIITKQNNKILLPFITFLLPLLKRDDLESALYSMVELGASSVQLILTDKISRAWAGHKEFERAQRIMIAAAEQSKHFAFPELFPPQSLISTLEKIPYDSTKIFFDVNGTPALSMMNELHEQNPQHLFLVAGPEADLTQHEKKQLESQHFKVCQLTPTILRSVQAITLGLGLVRSTIQ